MGATSLFVAQILALSALIGGTIEYWQILRRRAAARRLEQARLAAEESGRRGLVRVLAKR